jgi:addiction module HigA family antidote
MLPKNRVSTHPGEILRHEFLKPLGITQVALAQTLGVDHHVVSEITNCKRDLSPRMCALLAKAFGTSAEFWSGLQADHDLTEYLQSADAKEADSVKPLVA